MAIFGASVGGRRLTIRMPAAVRTPSPAHGRSARGSTTRSTSSTSTARDRSSMRGTCRARRRLTAPSSTRSSRRYASNLGHPVPSRPPRRPPDPALPEASAPCRRGFRLYSRSLVPPRGAGPPRTSDRGGLSSMAEHRIVAPKVTGSSPVGHPNPPGSWWTRGRRIKVSPTRPRAGHLQPLGRAGTRPRGGTDERVPDRTGQQGR